MPGILPSSKILAYSEACPRQIIEYSGLIYGFQCHLEFTQHSLLTLIDNTYEVEQLKNKIWVQETSEIIEIDTREMNTLLFQFLDALVLKYKTQLYR